MTWHTITGAGVSIATKFFGDAMNKLSNMLNGVDISDTVSINPNVTWTFRGNAFRIRDSDDSDNYIFVGGDIAGDRNVLLPVLAANDTIDFIGTPSTHTGAKTFNDTKFFLRNVADSFSASFVNTISQDRIYTLPDATGTIVITGLANQLTNTELTAGAFAKITGVGTIATGTWEATAIANGFIANLPALGVNPSPARQTAITNAELAGSIALSKLASQATLTVVGRVAGGSGVPIALTATQLTTIPNVFTDTLKGLVPLSGGGTTNFLRADGTFNAPSSGTAAHEHSTTGSDGGQLDGVNTDVNDGGTKELNDYVDDRAAALVLALA